MEKNQYAAFENSANLFIRQFADRKDKKIVIYGIGQYTAALLPRMDGFQIAGLMDGDCSNTGKIIYGYKVISLEEAESKADLIVINTSPFYWEMIFQRIADSKIPVYYANGDLACKKERACFIDEKCRVSFDEMKEKIDRSDVVSFDFYDTLVMRLVYSPVDILKITEQRVKHVLGEEISFVEWRSRAAAELAGKEYTFHEIYRQMENYVDPSLCERMKHLELDTETMLTVVRKDMAALFDYAVGRGKEVFILSDMYLSGKEIKGIAAKCGIHIEETHLWVSCEMGKSKKSGEMWKAFAQRTEGRKTIHFGDSDTGDAANPRKEGIEAAHIPGPAELLKNSALQKITPYVNSLHSSLVMGILLKELFNSPFVFEKAEEELEIYSCKTFGKCIFGDITLTYLLKVLSEAKRGKIDNLVFLARDGYFLKQDFDLLCKMTGVQVHSSYLFVSRKMILSAASDDEEAYLRLVKSDYNGEFAAYLQDRFGVEIDENDRHGSQKCCMPNDYPVVSEWLKPYEKAICGRLALYRRNYKNYLKCFLWEKKTAVVDICYAGTIQYWLSRILNTEIAGYYFVADLSEENPYYMANRMIPCFQDSDDKKAEKSCIWKNHKLIESFYTAPYGMVKSIDDYGNFETYPPGNNQKCFMEREQMNGGIREFMDEYIERCAGVGLDLLTQELDRKFTDALFGVFLGGGIVYGEAIKRCFWHEDGFINSAKEYSLF